MPVPVRATVVGLLLALLVTVRVPVRAPAAVGLNVTVTVQEPPTATLRQLLVWLKSPVTATPETVAAVVPELVTVTVWAAARGADHRARRRTGWPGRRSAPGPARCRCRTG